MTSSVNTRPLGYFAGVEGSKLDMSGNVPSRSISAMACSHISTLLHTGGEANHHAAIFAAYAASGTWAAVHAAQFACMAIFLGGLFGLFFALEAQAGAARWAARFGAARPRRGRPGLAAARSID